MAYFCYITSELGFHERIGFLGFFSQFIRQKPKHLLCYIMLLLGHNQVFFCGLSESNRSALIVFNSNSLDILLDFALGQGKR